MLALTFARSLVLYEDEAIIAFDKPPGLSSQGGRIKAGTLNIWAGPLTDNHGNLRVAAGQTVGDAFQGQPVAGQMHVQGCAGGEHQRQDYGLVGEIGEEGHGRQTIS